MDIHQRLFLFICQYQISSEMGQGLDYLTVESIMPVIK